MSHESHNSEHVRLYKKDISNDISTGEWRRQALEVLRKESNFSPLVSVLNSIIPEADRSKYEQTFQKGETIFSPWEDKHIYVLINGNIAIQTQSRTGDKTIAKIHGVNTIGEWTIFGRSFKPVKAIAESFCRIFVLSDADLLKFERENPGMMHRFYRLTMAKMNHHLREANHQLSEYQSLMQQLSIYLASDGAGLLDMLVYFTNAFCLEQVILIEKHPILKDTEILRYDSSLGTDLLYEKVNSEEYMKVAGGSKDAWMCHQYVLALSGEMIATLMLIESKDDPLLPKDQQVIERSIPTISCVLHAYQQHENQNLLNRKIQNQDLHDSIF
jgi:CRP-like cAMP-binding protein